jgi:hypothetical protein
MKEDDDYGVGVGMIDDGVNKGGRVEVEQDDRDGKMAGLGDDLGVVSDSQEGAELDAQGKMMKDVDHGVGVGMYESGVRFDDVGVGVGSDAQDEKKDGSWVWDG